MVAVSLKNYGVELPGVHWGLEFLRANRGDEQPRLSGDVLVIGGGDVAVDAAITAKRLGAAKVSMACLESRETMPAYPHNQADALREGIECHCGFGPGTILQENGHVAGMELKTCIRVVDEQGRFAPLFDENATMRIRADHIIFAIGQASELDGFAKDVRTEQGRIVIEDVTFSTSAWGIFAAGDAATGPSSVVSAIAGGRECAFSIDRMLKGADIRGERERKRPELPEEQWPREGIRHEPRQERASLPAPADDPFAETLRPLDMEACFAEALRCMTCGSKSRITYTDDCMTCFNCELNCSSGAIYVHPFKERFARTLDQIEADNR